MATSRQILPVHEQASFGDRLRNAREDQDLSRPVLARMTNGVVSARVIDHLENGGTKVTLEHAEALSDALNINRSWLMFGDPEITPDNDNGLPVLEPVEGLGSPEIPVPTGPDRSEIPLNTGQDQSRPVGTSREQFDASASSDTLKRYYHEMVEILNFTDTLRKEGFSNHPRKMPKLIDEAIRIADFLEVSEIETLCIQRGVGIEDLKRDETPEAALSEMTMRLIDTALLGVDLYELDFDALKTFAKNNDISEPLFGWRGIKDVINAVRKTYWSKALSGSINLKTSISEIK